MGMRIKGLIVIVEEETEKSILGLYFSHSLFLSHNFSGVTYVSFVSLPGCWPRAAGAEIPPLLHLRFKNHQRTSAQAHTHRLYFLKHISWNGSWRRWAVTVFITWQPLPSLPALPLFLSFFLFSLSFFLSTQLPPLSPFFYVDTDVQDLTHAASGHRWLL